MDLRFNTRHRKRRAFLPVPVSEWVRLISELDTVHSFMLMRHDKIIAQAWWSPCRPEYKHELFSLSKSFTSAAIGIAQAEGCLRIDDRLAGFFPEKISAAVSERMKRVTLRHLLTMSSGHETCPMSELRPRRDWVKGFLESSLAFEPGTRFVYNSAATYMLASVIRRTTGQNVLDYLQERLLHPLGIDAHQWDCCPMGTNVGGWGFWLRTEDLLRFGRLLQHNGNWEGRQLIPSDYLREATSKQIDNSDNAQPDWKLGYGFQFWRTSFNSFRADGACGQYVLVMPEQDLVLAVTSGVSNMQSILTHFWNTVYPALRETALEENPEARKQLEKSSCDTRDPPGVFRPHSAIPKPGISCGAQYDRPEETCFPFHGAKLYNRITMGRRQAGRADGTVWHPHPESPSIG